MRLIILGSPGAGKGTQAKFITEKYRIPHVSTGDIFRTAIQQKSDLGMQVKAIVESGRLVPDDIVIALVKDRIHQPDCNKGFLLDGFPRTDAQAKALHQQTPIDAVIDIDVADEEIVKRLSGRRIHPASGRVYHAIFNPPRIADRDDVTGEPLIQRPDDTEETIRKRLAVYHAQTKPLRDYYQQHQQNYAKIDGTDNVDRIKTKISAFLERLSHESQNRTPSN